MPRTPTPQNVHLADETRVSPERPAPGRTTPPGLRVPVHTLRPAEPEGRALRRGLLLLEAVQRSGDVGARVVELCRALALERATVHRLLATLIDCGHVQRQGRWHYVAAPGAALRGTRQRGDIASEMAQRLAPVLAQVSAGCGDAAFAVVREGHSAWCVARHIGSYPVQILAVQVGSRQPLGVGAAGLALLAALPEAEARAAISAHGDALARYGGMTVERLRILVRSTRERGWSVVGNHAVKGVLGVGRALRDANGLPLAGISVAASMDRMTRQRQRMIAGLMDEALAAA